MEISKENKEQINNDNIQENLLHNQLNYQKNKKEENNHWSEEEKKN